MTSNKKTVKSFNLDSETIETLNGLAEFLKLSPSDVVRIAIDDLGAFNDYPGRDTLPPHPKFSFSKS